MNRQIFALVLLFLFSVLQTIFAAETRTWRSGKHTVKAEFVSLKNGKVTLKRNGKETKIPLSRLSKADQQYVKQMVSKGSAASKTQTNPNQKKAIQAAASEFLTILVKQDEDLIKDIITSKADSSDAVLSKFPKPDRRSPKYVRKIVIKKNQADVNVSYKVNGRLKKYKVTMTHEGSDWRVLRFIGDDEEVIELAKVDPEAERSRSRDDEEDAADRLADGEDDEADDEELAQDESDDEPVRSDGESLSLPDDPVEIVAYIKKQQKKRPSSTSGEELAEFVKQQSANLIEATDRILDGYDVGKKEIEFAVATKFTTLQALIKYDPETAAPAVEEFLIKLEDLELEQHLPRASSLILTSELAVAESSNEIKIVVRDVVSHLKKVKKLSTTDTLLAKMALEKSTKLGDEAAAEAKKSLESILSKATS